MNIKIATLIAQNDGKLPTYIEGSELPIYYTTINGRVFCPKCANALLKGEVQLDHTTADDLNDYEVNWADEKLQCYSNHSIDTATLEILDERGLNVDENKWWLHDRVRFTKCYT